MDKTDTAIGENGKVSRQNPSHHKGIMQEQEAMMLSPKYTDVTFIVDGLKFECHKVVFASACAYFDDLFTEKYHGCTEIPLSLLTCELFQTVRDFIYNGNLNFRPSWSFELLKVATEMNYSELKDVVGQYLADNLSVENWLLYLEKSFQFDVGNLKRLATDYIVNHFTDIAKSPSYLEASKEIVHYMLALNHLKEECEDKICEHLLTWLDHAPKARYQGISELLLLIRLECLSPEFIQYTLLRNPHVAKNEDVVEKLHCLLKHLLFNEPLPPFVSNIFPRIATDARACLFIIEFSEHREDEHTIDYNISGFNTNRCFDLVSTITKTFSTKKKAASIFGSTRSSYYSQSNPVEGCKIGNTIYTLMENGQLLKLDMATLGLTQCERLSESFMTFTAGWGNKLLCMGNDGLKIYSSHQNSWKTIATWKGKHIEQQMSGSGSNWFLTDGSSQCKMKTYGSAIDVNSLYIFGVKCKTGNGVTDATHIVRVNITTGEQTMLTLKLPKALTFMQVVPYKDHVIVAGSEATYVISLQMLRKSSIVDDTCAKTNMATDAEQSHQKRRKLDEEIDGERDKATTSQPKAIVTPVQGNVTVSVLEGLKDCKIKLCRIGNQLVQLRYKDSYSYSYWGTEIEGVIRNDKGLKWRKLAELSKRINMDQSIFMPVTSTERIDSKK